MIRYFDLKTNTDNNFADSIDTSYMIEIENDNKPYGMRNGQVVCLEDDEQYLQEQALKERNKIDHLSLTKREFLLALYSLKDIKPSDIKNLIKDNVQAGIEFEYSSAFYRGNPLFNQVGALLGITPEELDNIFISLNNKGE